MSEEKPFKLNMSFEDAMKKIANTNVNAATQINEKGKEYEVYAVAGKKVKFTQLTIAERRISNFYLKAIVKQKNKKPKEYIIPLPIDPNQAQINTVYINYPLIQVPKDGILFVTIEGSTDETFEVGSLHYQIQS